jgi:hypothetical protein
MSRIHAPSCWRESDAAIELQLAAVVTAAGADDDTVVVAAVADDEKEEDVDGTTGIGTSMLANRCCEVWQLTRRHCVADAGKTTSMFSPSGSPHPHH